MNRLLKIRQTILSHIVDIVGKSYIIIYEKENLHIGNKYDINMSSK